MEKKLNEIKKIQVLKFLCFFKSFFQIFCITIYFGLKILLIFQHQFESIRHFALNHFVIS
jgi:hypothetical protein